MDRTLIEAARSGDEEAFASIARGSADRLFAVAYRILRDVGRAEDAAQHTLVTAWRQLPELREVDRFEAWIHRILVNACYAEAKRARQWSTNVRMLPVDGPAEPDTTLGAYSVRIRPLPDTFEQAFCYAAGDGPQAGSGSHLRRPPSRHRGSVAGVGDAPGRRATLAGGLGGVRAQEGLDRDAGDFWERAMVWIGAPRH